MRTESTFLRIACKNEVGIILRFVGIPLRIGGTRIPEYSPRSGGVMRNVGMKYQYSYEEQWQPKNIPVTFRMYQLNLDGCADRVYRGYWEASAVRFVEAGL